MHFVRPFIPDTDELRRKYGESIQIQLIYEDLPVNDFNSLFREISGITANLYNIINLITKS